MAKARETLFGKLNRSGAVGGSGGCIVRVRAHYGALNPAQKKVADYVISQRSVLPQLDLRRLADGSKVSVATVTRFCRRIGFSSFHAFKIASAQELASVPLVFEDFDLGDDDETRIGKVFAAYIQSLVDTRAIVSIPDLVNVADHINRATRVGIFGIGSSGSIAEAASHRFALLGIPCQAHTDPYEQIIAASLMTEKDVAIGVSHSGTSRVTIDGIQVAKEHGAFTVGITNHADSPLGREVSICLLTSLHENKVHVASLTSRVAQTTIIDCLYITLAARNENRFRRTVTAVDHAAAERLRADRRDTRLNTWVAAKARKASAR